MYYHEFDGAVSKIQTLPLTLNKSAPGFLTDVDLDGIVLTQALNYYARALSKNERAQDFLKDRCIFDKEAISQFHLGFADRTLGLSLQRLNQLEQDKSRGALQRIGLLKPSGHEFFRGAIIFPFTDSSGNVNGGYGRRITHKLKSHSVYHVHCLTEQTTFFNVSALEKYSVIILCKNPIDALSWWCYGYKNCISLMGIFGFSKYHLKQLKSHGIKQVYLAFGATEDELSVSWIIGRQLMRTNIAVNFIIYPNAMDANALVQSTDNPQKALHRCLMHSLMVATSIKGKLTLGGRKYAKGKK